MIDNIENTLNYNLESNSNLVFIDSQIIDYQSLIPNMEQAEVIILEPDVDGIEQITAALEQRQELSSIHIISHGDVGYLQLGNSSLNAHNLVNYTDELEQWSESLSDDADVLLYGCDVTAEDTGVEFIYQLSNLIGADVAASNDLTGNSLLEGDWQLETATGEIESSFPLDRAVIEDYNYVFAVAEDNLVMELKLDETSGTQAADTSTVGQDNNGTLINGAFFENVGGELGGGVTLDGDNDYIKVLNSDDINLQNYAQRSISIWFKADDVNIDSKKQVIYEEGGDGRGLNIYLDNGQLYVGGWNYPESNWTGSFLSTAEVSSDKWHHVALVLDAEPGATSVQEGAFTAYLDGAEFASGVGSQLWAHANGIGIGGIQGYTRFHDGIASGIATRTLGGTIADVRLYNAALSADEINTLASLATPNAGAISLSTNKFKVNETDATVDVSVVRTEGSDGTVTVDYHTFDNSAVAGEDYEAVAGTFTFASGETTKSVSIPILEDSVTEDIEQFSFTIDNVTGATLLAPRTALIDIIDADGTEPPTFSFDNFSDTSNLKLNGNATKFGNKLRLTPPENHLAGSAFYNKLIEIDADTSFHTNFQFQLSEGGNANGADGFTFTLQNTPLGLDALGDFGVGLGYTGIGTESIAVEFDTFQNSFDPNNNHVSILQNGDATEALSTATPSFDLNSGEILNAWIDYDGANDLLSVFVSDTTDKPETALLSETLNIQLSLGSQAFVGFTAGTGGLNNAHDILSWDFTTTGEVLDSPIIPPGNEIDETVISGLVAPIAIEWTPDGSKLFVAEKRGTVRLFENGQLQSGLVVDIQAQVNNNSDRGLLDIAIHPDFDNHPYLYLLYTYDPPEVFNYPDDAAAKPDGNGNRAGRLTRVTLDPSTNYTSIMPDSEEILLGATGTWDNFNGFVNSTVDFDEPPAGILADGSNLQDFLAADSQSHSIGSVEFGLDGALYVTNGDGTSYNQIDPRTVRVQDLNNLSGKVLRIDPITGKGLSDNLFYDGNPDSNISKVYQSGFRNPFRMTIHPETGQVYIGDVGWRLWEEVNTGEAGANFGWPFFEGGSGENIRTPQYEDLPEAEAFYNSGIEATPSIFALNHGSSGINAIIMGDIYTGSTYPAEFQGDLFFNDLGQGIVRNISFDASGNVSSVEVFSTEAQIVVQIAQGPDGNLYYVDLNDGIVGRWNFG